MKTKTVDAALFKALESKAKALRATYRRWKRGDVGREAFDRALQLVAIAADKLTIGGGR
jgi:hypothetical protein